MSSEDQAHIYIYDPVYSMEQHYLEHFFFDLILLNFLTQEISEISGTFSP